MAISITWGSKTIHVPQSYLTNITGTLYELDTDQLRLDLKALEDDVEGMPFPDTHRHNTAVTIAGVTYARFIEIINGYKIEFEDGQYSVRLAGSNNNFFDVEAGVLSQNQVQVIPGNAAGLQVVSVGSGLSVEQDAKLTSIDNRTAYQIKIIDNKRLLVKVAPTWYLRVFDDNGTTVILEKALKDASGNEITDIAAGILAQELATSV
jgi:hypothetical protein